MRITEVIRRKGDKVVTIRPDETIAYLLATLDEHHIGALLVSEDGGQTLVGFTVSERDVVRTCSGTGRPCSRPLSRASCPRTPRPASSSTSWRRWRGE